MVRENELRAAHGLTMVAVLVIVGAGLGYALSGAIRANAPGQAAAWALAMGVWAVLVAGFFMVQPNQGKALQLFGRYVGTVKKAGLWWTNPFFTKRSVSMRVRNFETAKLKVNDHDSNPIEIGAVVVWQVVDTAEALFEVDNFEDYVRVQSESALRGLANQYPYDTHTDAAIALSRNTAEVAERLKGEIQDRLAKAGVRVLESRISHLAYAAEIAGVMLRRQQASAIISARAQIVDGAVGMVEQALTQLSQRQIVKLDEERKAQMVSNLLTVLCSEQPTTPVVNTGTLY